MRTLKSLLGEFEPAKDRDVETEDESLESEEYSSVEEEEEEYAESKPKFRQVADGLLSREEYQGKAISRKDYEKGSRKPVDNDVMDDLQDSEELEEEMSETDLYEEIRKMNQVPQKISITSQVNENEQTDAKDLLSLIQGVSGLRVHMQSNMNLINQMMPNMDLVPYYQEAGVYDQASSVEGLLGLIRSLEKASLPAEGTGLDYTDFDSLWTSLHSKESSCLNDIDQTLDTLWSKTQFHSESLIKAGKLKTINQGIKSQIDYILKDKTRLYQRARTLRVENALTVEGLDLDVYDDNDYFQAFLKELVDSKAAVQRVEAFKKTKKVVDTKASKGRKVRYDVHEKLVNFMAPLDFRSPDWTDDKMDLLYHSLPKMVV